MSCVGEKFRGKYCLFIFVMAPKINMLHLSKYLPYVPNDITEIKMCFKHSGVCGKLQWHFGLNNDVSEVWSGLFVLLIYFFLCLFKTFSIMVGDKHAQQPVSNVLKICERNKPTGAGIGWN